jgi:hypothetical protein
MNPDNGGNTFLRNVGELLPDYMGSYLRRYSKCHVTSNKVTSEIECAEDKFQTREWVRETPPTGSYARDLTRNAGPSKLRDTCYTSEQGHE